MVPRCYRHGRPIFCQRRGYVSINGRRQPKWICPLCRGWYTQAFRSW